MVRTLPAGLANLINASGQQPTMTVTVQDVINRFALQASNGDAGGRTSAIVTASGALLRARVTQGADPNSLAVQRIVSPLTYGQWTAGYPAAIAADCFARAGCALVQRPSDSLLFVFYQSSADSKVKYRTSSNDGVSWSAETDAGAGLPLGIGNFCYGIAATAASGTVNLYAAYASYDPGGNASFYRSTAVNSGVFPAWTSEGPTSPSWGKIRGLQAHPSPNGGVGGYEYFAAGIQTRAGLNGLAGGTFQRLAGGGYNSVTAVQQLDNPGLGLSVQDPSIHFDGATFYYAATLFDDGSVSGQAGNRTTVYVSTDTFTWNPWQSFAGVFSYGAHALPVGGVVLLFDGTSLYTASAAAPSTDLTGDVLSLAISERLNAEARGSVVLANGNGQWSSSVALRVDARVSVSLGYVDPSLGPLTVQTHLLIVDAIEWTVTALERTVTLTLRDATKLLDYPWSKLVSYTSLTVGQITGKIAGLGGVPVSALPGTAQFAQTVGCFLITSGETLLTALLRASEIYEYDFFSDGTGTLRVVERQASDGSSWTYTTQHLGISYAVGADQSNVIRVIGQGSGTSQVYADVVDSSNLLLAGKERFRQEVERMLDTSAKCRIKASLILRDEQVGAVAAQMAVPMNPAHELTDVVTVTDSAVGLAGVMLRIGGIDLEVHPEAATWMHTLHLTGV